ncbi:MAG: DEAD/DEAH box helicase [Clostridium sp.]|uniref:DEAD/DEAH box helicase n=1 Tax=Clostridium TaxID=1485 RepID=UPI0029035D5C|nr:DEAD/DEAH box helicase [Clostridium sp.]MDU1280010.1 DEAD/DEAH box helicase [Clostridium sp.]MDU7089075.1 DEAD/DEAH box helicase [Clostridium sp.]
MYITIEYIDSLSSGKITSSDNLSNSIWNRVIDIILGLEPTADITSNSVLMEWSTLLSSIPKLGYLRKQFGMNIVYDDNTKVLLNKYKREVLAIRKLSGTQSVTLNADEINDTLKTLNFTKRDLKPYQLRDTAKLASLANGANFSVPGAGKTTVTFATHILTRDTDTKLLVVAPKNAFVAWDEVIIDCMDDSVVDKWKFTRLIGGIDSIKSILSTNPMRMLITYDQFIRVQPIISSFLTNNKVHVILDESHRMKGGLKSQRGISLLKISHLPVRRDILSGTPLPRSIEDLIAQLDFIWPGQRLGYNILESNDPHALLDNLYVRTTKKELGLPNVQREFIPVEMSQPQIALYSLIRQETLKHLTGIKMKSNIDLNSARKSVLRLLQVSTNPIIVVKRLTQDSPNEFNYEDPKLEHIFKAIVEEFDSPKILKACDLARNLALNGQKCVIWSSFTDNVERIAEILSDIGATFIHGGVDTGDEFDISTREGRLKLFNDPNSKCFVLVANPAACSEGISLHKVCHHAIYVDRSFNAAHYLQSVDRIHRLGLPENQETYIHVLESIAPNSIGAIDFSVRRRLITKLNTMYEVLKDFDLHSLALDEEDEDAPVNYDITFEDLIDIIDELSGSGITPEQNEVI